MVTFMRIIMYKLSVAPSMEMYLALSGVDNNKNYLKSTKQEPAKSPYEVRIESSERARASKIL